MPANRCSTCNLDWPRTREFKECFACKEKTDPVSNIKGMSLKDARKLKKEFLFYHFYEKWDEEQPAERLDPANSTFLQNANLVASIPEPEKSK